ncbi:LOW QUALITY PROTEIN: sperm-associated antigen 17 [Anableps anableps]
MPPAGGKKGAATKSGNVQSFNKNWEADLVKAQFEESSWKACVSIVVGKAPEEEELIQPLVLALQQSQRKLFTPITWDSSLAKIHELGNPKAKRPNDLPMFYEATEVAKALLDAGEEISCNLVAKILKFQLLHIKTCDKRRREAERLKVEGQKEKVLPRTDTKAKVPDKKGKRPPPVVEPSKEKKTKLKRRDDVETPVYIDDEPDNGPQHYIVLVGLYQPQLIGELDAIGVHVANVIKVCSEHKESSPEPEEQSSQEEEKDKQSLEASPVLDAEVPGNARKLDLFWSHLRSVLDSGPPHSKLHDVIQLNYTVPDLTLPSQTQDPQTQMDLGNRIFDDVARLIYDSLKWRQQHQHYLDNVRLISIPTSVTLDAEVEPTVAHITRSKKKPVSDQYSPSSETKLPSLFVDVDMYCYSSLLDLVPPEACSVPLILHCLLEQVVISSEEPLPATSHMPEKQTIDSGLWLDCDLVSYMLQSFFPLLNTEERHHLLKEVLTIVQKEEDKMMLLEKFGTEHAQKKPEQPLVIRHHDERGIRLQNITVVHGFNPSEAESSMMRSCPIWNLIQSVAEQGNGDSCWNGMKQQLQHYCSDESMSWPEVERLLLQSVFEGMTLTAVDHQGVLLNDAAAQQQTQSAIPWDNPVLYAKQRLQTLQTTDPAFLTEDPGNTEQLSRNVCCQLDLSEIQNCRQRSLFDWHYTEHHNAAVFPQVLKKASDEYCYLDIFRGSYKNILYVFCHNPMDSNRLSKQFWDEALHTDVKFRKYLEHVADKISNWTKEEELKMEEKQLKNQTPPATAKDESPEGCIVEEEALEPVIRKDSLKAWKLDQERLKKEELAKKSKKENAPKGKQKKEKVETSNKKSKATSGDKTNRADKGGGLTKIPSELDVTKAPAEDERRDLPLTEEPDNRFIGYIMDGQLIHVSGCVQEIYPSDGGRITVENVSFAEGSTLMKVAVRKDGHHFYTHVNQVVSVHLQPPTEPQIKDNVNLKEGWKALLKKAVKLGSFSAVLRNQVHLSYSFYGPTGEYEESFEKAQEEIPNASTEEPVDFSSSNLDLKEIQSSQECKDQSAQPSPPFNSLSLSVPNGLLLQILREETQGVSPEEGVLIRQSFPLHCKGPGQQLQDKSLSKELYRVITSQGVVIRYMRDGSTEVLFPDGSVSFSPDSGPCVMAKRQVWLFHEAVLLPGEDQSSENEAEVQKASWQTTSSSGDRVCTIGTTLSPLPTPSVRTFKATDPITHQVMLTREDLVVMVQNPDGSLIAEHADGTRITSLFLVTPPNERAPDCVTTSEEDKDACDEEERMSTNSPSCKLNEIILNDESEEGRDATRERTVLVEKEGCASVVMYLDRHRVHLFLADGTIINGNNQAEYEVFPSGGGFLHIQSDGKCVYSSDLEPKGCSPTNPPGTYTMSHTEKVACDVTDNDGNHFQVMEDGHISVLNVEETDRATASVHVKHNELCPRLFLVHEDGSGTELLNAHIVEELLHEACSDPTIAVLNEPLPGKQDEFGITILKPSHQSAWSQWLLKKQIPDFTPPNLRNRSWKDFPPAENKSPGRPLSTDIRVGLSLNESCDGSAAQQQRVRSCPKVLEIRELYCHPPFTTPLRNTLDSRLKEYIESLMKKELQSEEMKLKEPHSEEEAAQASDILNLILSFAEEEDMSDGVDTRIPGVKTESAPVDYASLYDEGVRAPVDQLYASEESCMDAYDNLDILLLQEIREDNARREALRKKIAVPYFHPENFPIYQNLLQDQLPNTRRSQALPLTTKAESAEVDVKDASNQSTSQHLSTTPSQSESQAEESERMPESKHPTLPTQASDPGESSLRSSSRRYKSVQVDVTGKPRRSKVRLPACLLDSKPCSVPNRQFLMVKEPVRRMCRIVSMADPVAVLRGFLLNPSSVDFGTQQEGTYSSVTVLMKNVGVNLCRFRVKQPPTATGLRILYTPGPVPAGLQVKLQVQLLAMCDETEPKNISQDITILTETDILYLPVTADILWSVLRLQLESEEPEDATGTAPSVSGVKRREEEETREGHQQMRLVCRRPRHREIGHRLAAADGVTVLPASPPGRPMTSDVTRVGAARGRL